MLSRRGWWRWLGMVLVLSSMLALLGCGRGDAEGLVVLDWSGYEQEVFWADFKAKHPDVPVEWTFFADDSEAYAKLQSGFKADLVHPNVSWLEIMVENDMLQPIDTSKLSNWGGIMEPLAKMGQVDGVQYLVPWEWGYDSILVRTDKVAEVPDSWADLWDPQYAGHVSILDSAEAAVVAASLALGYDPYALTDAQLASVKQKLIELKPNLLGYWSDYTEINQQIASGEVWVGANCWPDAYVAVAAAGVPVEYITPQEGRIAWVYGYAIPKGSANADLAHDYIDALISVESMAEMANQYGYGAANAEVAELTDPQLVELFNLDQPEVLSQSVFFQSLSEAQRAAWTQLWDEVKASQ